MSESVQLKPVQLGRSGLRVSQLCLGTMNIGIPGRGHQGDWTLSEKEARPIFEAATVPMHMDWARVKKSSARCYATCRATNMCWRRRFASRWVLERINLACRASMSWKVLTQVSNASDSTISINS